MQRAGWIVEEDEDSRRGGSWGRRARRGDKITAEGKERFGELIADSGPQTFEDDGFGVHLAFFSRPPAEVRMRILEGRRRRVEDEQRPVGGGGRRQQAAPRHDRHLVLEQADEGAVAERRAGEGVGLRVAAGAARPDAEAAATAAGSRGAPSRPAPRRSS